MSRLGPRNRVAVAVIVVIAFATAGFLWRHPLSNLPLLSRFFSPPVDFSHDIRPIFNQNCVACHGGVRQKSGVSFIFREDALGTGKSGHPTIVPGDPDHSELIARLTSKDPEARMPYHAPPLPPEQISLLRRWIKEGAKWSDYWAFVPPKPQALPEVKQPNWVRQPMDRFILARLEKESLQPSPEARKAELLRRASLDLTGLPPTAEEQAAFQADQSPNAYEKQVDRLLASTAYGERWASMWLDLARYADTMGYEADNLRGGVWAYRDWVIDAYNRNLPYDVFVTKQLAGDLLPNPTFEDRIATSFHRQTPNNQEGGTDDEEFRLVEVMDRVATTWSVMNGLTMNCVQCHSHPYDPIRHADYYKTLAFFNTSRDADRDDDFPTLRIPKKPEQYAEVVRLQQESESLLHWVVAADRELAEKTDWKPAPIESADANEAPALEQRLPEDYQYLEDLRKDKDPPKQKAQDVKNQMDWIKNIKHLLAAARTKGPAKTFHIRDGEAFPDANTPSESFYELVAASSIPVITAIRVEVPPLDPAKARHTPEDGFVVTKVQAFVLQGGRKQPIAFRCFAEDSEENLRAAVVPEYAVKAKKKTPEVTDSFAANPKLFGTRWIVGVLATPLRTDKNTGIEVDLKQVRDIDSKPAVIHRVRLAMTDDPRWTTLGNDTKRLQAVRRLSDIEWRLTKDIKTVYVPVMSEQAPHERRTTLEFERGNFLTKTGPDLQPDVPRIFPPLPTDAPRNRLTLAKWFFTPGQPLTARVAVNRYWEQLFGTGMVETLENFGSVGEPPSHAELLDWLALHFQNDLHWDMKALLREMVTSAAYRQSAVTTPALQEKDPRNRLLARGPQQRLTAEMVRDQALVASGLLNRTMHGPPVMPPQPPGVWNSVYNRDKWIDEKGPNRYRRAVYTFVKRTSGYPSSLIFDASDRQTSLPRRLATNTPLQALVTLNDPVYEEAAAALAQRTLKDVMQEAKSVGASESILDRRLAYEARLVLSRDATTQELAVLRKLFEKAVGVPPNSMLKLVSFRSGQTPAVMPKAPGKEVDGLKAVANALLNLDAALNR